MAKEIKIKSPVKVITSGNAPGTSTLSNGQIAVGKVGGKKAIYANVNGTVGDMLSEVKDDIATNKANISSATNGVSAINAKLGVANGIATLDGNGKVPSSQLPSYVDDVLEYASLSAFPATGESGKIYIALDTNKTYRWGGSTYGEISASIALGETSSTAYAGNKGKANADAISVIKNDKYMRPTGWKLDQTGNGFLASADDGSGPTATVKDGVNFKCDVGNASSMTVSHQGAIFTLKNATASQNGAMSAADKAALDELKTNAVTSVELTVETI